MKLIARLPVNTSNDRILVNLTLDELANILGETFGMNLKKDFINDCISKETEIEISDIYKKHSLIKNLQNQREYDKARKKLEDILEALTPIEEKINIIKLPE